MIVIYVRLTLGILLRDMIPFCASRYGIPQKAPDNWKRDWVRKVAVMAADTVL